MKREIKSWLAKILLTTEANIDNILNEEKATTYLWVWSIFEQKVFDGFVKKPDLEIKSRGISADYDSLELDDIIRKFHKRYQDTDNFRHLKHSESGKSIEDQLSKDFDALTNEEKLYIALYVAYRYRNNIFHGNKGVLSWIHYTEQIKDCITIMIKITDIVVRKGGDESMALYHSLLLEVEGRTEGSTLLHLMRIGHGKYAEIIQECIRKGLIETLRKNTIGEDLYFISDKGREFLNNPKEELL